MSPPQSEDSRNSKVFSSRSDESKNGQIKVKPLPERKFEVRESLLTELFKNPHIKTVQHIFAASLVGLMVNTVAQDYHKNGEIRFGFHLIAKSFGKIELVVGIWLLLNFLAIVSYGNFKLWANFRRNLQPKDVAFKILDYTFLSLLVGYYILSFKSIAILVEYFDLPIGSSAIVCLEHTRIVMKIHAFMRSNAPKVLKFKTHSDQKLNIANLTHFIYFLFAPTLVYRDQYPRSKTIRWNFILERSAEIIGVIFYYAFLVEKFMIQPYQHIGLKRFTASQIILSICENSACGLLCLLCGFYVVLHSVQNLVGELLRFGDRMFYKDWWTSTNYPEYFRTWNVVVYDWLYTYIYKDIYEFLVPGNKSVAKFAVFVISAIVHEWVLTYMFHFFFPALFMVFLFSGTVMTFFRTPKLDIINVIFWYFLAFGSGLLTSLYSMEYFVRINVPVENHTLWEVFVPRLFTCDCIG
ncbi:sterol O-acyltransferase 1-like [Cylas formicarius]|uniref:sterol O-acyltransferase 1-like n=1 Tax=Cylas formicarius TaxID=197179 RepID=UPI0029587523|nr:sterol O-acyltransferase 1-like [Cylas formicarius]XP_060529893.1 sterol O-acyltransferase 1-like [Cylas formicarius]XP_060529894.1 sterol O-acyltransferase 1-like [Cylas formicarius]XP_060529895.1 sterol O-acyltransferase 1-like [Cylas formicarius]